MKILIADDERPIRDWLKFMVTSLDPSLEIVGLARNGEEALHYFEEFHPDILFIDIKMPLINGIDVLETISAKSGAPCYIVVLSNYDNFEFARQAMKYNAAEYILKSEIDPSQLGALLQRAGDFIKGASGGGGLTRHYHELRQAVSLYDQQGAASPEMQAMLHKLGVSLHPSGIFAICIQFSDHRSLQSFEPPPHALIKNPALFLSDSDKIIFLANIAAPQEAGSLELLAGYAHLITETAPCICGIGRIKDGYEKIVQTVEEAGAAVDFSFYTKSGVHVYEELANQESLFSQLAAIQERISVSISSQNKFDSLDLLKSACELISAHPQLKTGYVKQYLKYILYLALSRFNQLYTSSIFHSFEEINNTIASIDFFPTLQEYAVSTLTDILGIGAAAEYSPYVYKAITYIEKNYAKPLTVTDIANHVCINRDYLCRVMSRELHMTPSQYLTHVRIEYAIKLLETSDMKINAIAEQTGYASLSYFSKVFKTTTGLSPNSFRAHSDQKKYSVQASDSGSAPQENG